MPHAITPEKDLRTGTPVWPPSHLAGRRLAGSLRCDVVVVGAGISGAFMAHALAQRFGKVVVVDRRAPVHGSTAASTAMLQWEIDTPLTELIERIGADKAARAWRRSYAATQDLVKLVTSERIACGLERRAALYLAGDRMGSRGLAAESRARNKAGLPGGFLNAPDLRARFNMDRTGAILSPDTAIADPVRLAGGLLRRAIAAGASLYAPVTIRDVLATPHGVVLDAGAHFIEARHAVFCTGYEVLKGLPRKGTKITSSWAMATRPHARYPRWLDRVLVWEASDPYLYMRSSPDGRLIVGGEDADIDLPSYRTQSMDRKTARLIAKAQTLLPGTRLTAARRWSGAFGESQDGLPVIDAVPGLPGCFAVMGFGGNGTIYSMIAAQLVPRLLKGRSDPDADIFRFRDGRATAQKKRRRVRRGS